jgi:hypothetical protein
MGSSAWVIGLHFLCLCVYLSASHLPSTVHVLGSDLPGTAFGVQCCVHLSHVRHFPELIRNLPDIYIAISSTAMLGNSSVGRQSQGKGRVTALELSDSSIAEVELQSFVRGKKRSAAADVIGKARAVV